MLEKILSLIFISLHLVKLEGAYIAPPPQQNSIDILRHQINNQEVEIRIFENKFEGLETILENVQEQVQELSVTNREQIKSSANVLEVKIHGIESIIKGFVADLQQLKNHANETTASIQAFKKALIESDQKCKLQNQNIENLSAALHTILDALQIKTEAVASVQETNSKTYKIKNGDSLAKIASNHGTSVNELKRINNLTSDKIVVGKILKLQE